MKEIQVGKVMLTFKGEYDSTKTYTRLDAVTYQGSSYVCLADTSSTPPSDSWQVLAQKGTDGKDGKDGQPGHDGKDGKDGQTPDVSNMATKDELAEYYPQKMITTGTVDFNTLTGSGEYFVGTKCTNGPTDGSWSAWCYVVVSGDSRSRVSQLVFLDNTNRSYYRRKTDATWSDWVAFANFSDIGDQLGNYYTKSQTDSAINNIHIGGRNLVAGSGQDFVADDTANTGANGGLFATIHLTEEPKIGDQLTVSCEATITGKGKLDTFDIILYNENTDHARSKPQRLTTGKRSSATLEVTNLDGVGQTVLLIYAGDFSDTEGKKNTIHHLKVERGNKATDWTPAPEDTITAIQKNSTAIDQTNQQITDLQMAVSNTVTTITSGTLADLASKTGVYHYEIDFIPSDSPTHDGGLLDVVVGANYAKQVFTNTANSDVYVRTRKQGVWSAWRQVTLWN